jgi:hypothetical protein
MVKGIISGIEFPGCLQVQPFIEEVIELPLIPGTHFIRLRRYFHLRLLILRPQRLRTPDQE